MISEPSTTPVLSAEEPLLGPGADGTSPRAEERVAQELEDALAGQLFSVRRTADVGQVTLAAVTTWIFWGMIPNWELLGWFGVLTLTALIRAVYRNAVGATVSGGRLLALARHDVWMSATMWGVFPLLLLGAPIYPQAVMLIIFAGLVAAATSTLVADGAAFGGFMALVLGPMVFAVAMGGADRDRINLLLVTFLYAPFMVTIYRRARALLIEHVTTASRLRISEEETARRRDFLNALVAYAPSLIVVSDVEGRILRANPAFEEIVGYALSDILGEPLHELVAWGDDAERLHGFVQRVGAGERVVGELQIRRRDGQPLWLRVSGMAARGMAEGTLIMVGEDVTEQVEAREVRERARADAEATARAKSSFLASMSHEIRTPMNGILGMIELLLDSDLSDHQRESAEVIRSSGQGLLRILNDVLDMSKMEAGQLDLESIDFDLHGLLSDAARIFALAALNKGIELIVDIGPEVPRGAHGDPIRLRQILTNLLANAVKFTHQGEVVLSAGVRGRTPDAADFVFTVRDTGIGVPADKLSVIFDEFEQAEQSTTRTFGGTGLGLTICRRLAELMGGQIHAASVHGEGSEFFLEVSLPTPERVASNGFRRRAKGLQDRRFLVVDDNATARRIVREALIHVGAAEVIEADGVDRGLEAARAAVGENVPFDAIVLDHMMPGRDGFEFAREMDADPRLEDVPMLMLTSGGDVGSSHEARDAGVDGYLSKPVSRATLLQALSTLMERDAPTENAEELVTEATLSARSRQIRILLAEDNAVNQQVALALLGRQGYHVTAVWDGKQALEALDEGLFDVVLMDIQMPEMDGLEATRRIRTTPGVSAIPVIALTAHAFAEERERCRLAGMNDFLAKPFRPEDLFDLVERWADDPAGSRGALDQEPDEAASEDAADEPVDVEGFRSVMRAAGVEEVVDTTIGVYLEEAPTIFSALRAAVAEGDSEGIRTRAHSLKSSSGNIRAHGLASGLRELESLGRSDDVEGARRLFPGVEQEYERVIDFLESRSR